MHARAGGRVTALCDALLLGKVFEQGGRTLDLKTYRAFYEGRKVSEKEAVELIKEAESLNLVGKKSLAAAKKAVGVEASAAKRVKGVPHLQVYRV